MDGIHDLGGKHGYGPVKTSDRDLNASVIHEPVFHEPVFQEPAFHEQWEATVFTFVMSLSAAGVFRNTDHFRHAVERIDPVSYLSDGYYGRWLGGVETALVEAGELESEIIQQRYLELGGDPAARIAARPDSSTYRQTADQASERGAVRATSQPLYASGDKVRTSELVKAGHTRLPAYARGKVGEVVAIHGGWVFPDTNAHGEGENPQNLYTVAFTGQTLWGGGDANLSIHLDLFEAYLELSE